MRIRAVSILAAVTVATVATAGCGSGESTTPTAAVTTTTAPKVKTVDLADATFVDESGKKAVSVDATDNLFTEQYIEVKAGTTVTFTNKGRNQHNVVPLDKKAFTMVDASDFQPSSSAEITFDEPGDYIYYCSLHGTPAKGMLGAVRVLK